MQTPQLNLVLAWVWLSLGFFSGLLLGLFFQQENWLGGYSSFKRRLYRLAHISFFGLGAVNLLFYFTVHTLRFSGLALAFPAWAFIIGAVSMPACCLVMAHFPRARALFAIPVLSLLFGGALTLLAVMHIESAPASQKPIEPAQTHSTVSYPCPSVSIRG